MTYKKLILTIASVAVISAPVAVLADAAPAVVDAGSSASASAPVTVDSGSSAGGSAPATTDSASSAGSNTAPATTDSASSAGGSAPATTDAGSSAGAGSSSGSTGGSPIISSGGSSSSSSGSYAYGYVNASGSTTTCPLITSYMRMGIVNNSADVVKLQAFLKNNQGLDVSVTGTFDAKTEAAVESFQKKYLSDILGPWGATKATGAVYITTVKKINQLACSQPLSLSAAELSIINAYKSQASNTEVSAPVTSPVTAPATQVGPTLETPSTTVGAAADANSNTAATGNASILSKFWSFIKNLF